MSIVPSIFDKPPNPEPEPPPSQASSDDGLRVGDVERQEALSVINDSYVAGRIDATELERRTSQAAAAVTRGDLQGATADLPGTQAIAQSFTSRLNELRADRQADEERRQTEAAEAAAGAQEAAAVAARLFREFATSLKDIVPPRPIATTHFDMRKRFLSRPRFEEIISPPGYQLYPNLGSDSADSGVGIEKNKRVNVIVADGRIWQSNHIGTQDAGIAIVARYRAGYVEPTPQILFSEYDFPLPMGRLINRAGLPYVRRRQIDAQDTEEPMENWLAGLAAEIMQRARSR